MGEKATILFTRDEDLKNLTDEINHIDAAYIDQLVPWAGPRPFLETCNEFRQFIPYVVIRQRGKILRYLRTSEGNESRLHGKISIGVGGHVDASDSIYNEDGSIDLLMTLLASAVREIQEEIGIAVLGDDLKIVAAIRSSASSVDMVHLAIVIVCDIDHYGDVNIVEEDTFEDTDFYTKEEILADEAVKETWTALTLTII